MAQENSMKFGFEMEIVNAMALAHRKEARKPNDWSELWESLYKHDAVELTTSVIELLK